jgi:hypothetical protein
MGYDCCAEMYDAGGPSHGAAPWTAPWGRLVCDTATGVVPPDMLVELDGSGAAAGTIMDRYSIPVMVEISPSRSSASFEPMAGVKMWRSPHLFPCWLAVLMERRGEERRGEKEEYVD